MKYTVRTTRGKHKLVEVEFEDERYELIGEMLLAERPFLNQIIRTLDKALENGETAEAFSGNAFSIEANCETAKITNDINDSKAEAPTNELKKLVKAYKNQYDKIKR